MLNESMEIKTIFSQAAHGLAVASLTTALPGDDWEAADHPYAYKTEGFRTGLDIAHSDKNGAWAVSIRRIYGEAQTELFVPRMALYAGVPAAPTFAKAAAFDGHVLSVIPFRHIVHSSDLLYGHSHDYLRHASYNLPFFLWMGQDMDRAYRNLCMDAQDNSRFAEFDFNNTSLSRVFTTANTNLKTLPPEISQSAALNIFRMQYENNVISASRTVTLDEAFIPQPILRGPFEEGLARVKAIPEGATDSVLNVVDQSRPVSREQREAVKYYLKARLLNLDIAYKSGRFNGYIQKTPIGPHRKMRADIIENSTYTFD